MTQTTKKSSVRDSWIPQSWRYNGAGAHKNKKKQIPRKNKHKGVDKYQPLCYTNNVKKEEVIKMKSVTFIKLTEKERLAMIRTEEAFEELKEHVNVDSGMLEEVELAHKHLINIIIKLFIFKRI